MLPAQPPTLPQCEPSPADQDMVLEVLFLALRNVVCQLPREIDAGKRAAISAENPLPAEMDNLEFLFTWMFTPNPLLGNLTPEQMILSGNGEKLVKFIREAREDYFYCEKKL